MSTPGKIGITLGDPTGIGPEIVAQTIAVADDDVRQRLMVFCDAPILERAFAAATGERVPTDLTVVDRGLMSGDQAVAARPSPASQKAQVAYLEAAISAARGNQIVGLVTAPISKLQARRAGFEFAGHTDFLADRLRAERIAMMFVSPRLKVTLATVHLSLVDAIAALSVDTIVDVTTLTAESLVRDFGLAEPRIGIVGLNPHAGEGGMFGREEYETVVPAAEECRRRVDANISISGALVPDVAFREAVDGKYDALVALYHDQGLIPIKLLDFDEAVNMTLGLPIVRTSPAHGVAYGIAGTGMARHKSFAAALELAVAIADRR